jgi:4-azaleucine resistance transporter AzlC
MIFCLADEAYALEVQDDRPSDVKREDFMFYIGFFDHLYWIAGSTIGAIAGSCVEFNSQGIEFAMTALFLVILIEQSWNKDNRKPIFIGLIATVISLLIFGAAKMLIPAMLFFIGGLLLFRKKIEVKEQEDNEL